MQWIQLGRSLPKSKMSVKFAAVKAFLRLDLDFLLIFVNRLKQGIVHAYPLLRTILKKFGA